MEVKLYPIERKSFKVQRGLRENVIEILVNRERLQRLDNLKNATV